MSVYHGVDTAHDAAYGSLEANVSCGASDGGGKKRKPEGGKRRAESKRKAYDRMDESIGMREYEMKRK